MKNHLLLHYCLLFVTAMLWGHDAHATCSFDKPINQSFKGGLHAEHPVTECLKEGEDPLKGYLRNEGNAFSRTKYHAILPRSVRAASALPNAYKKQACDPKEKKAGGKSSEGATDPCTKGSGKSLTSIPPQKVNVPICEDCTDCGVGLLGALIGAVTGGGGGMPDLSSTFSAAGNISRNGCVGGSIGICGLGTIGGSVCPSSLISANGMQPPSAVTTRSNRAQSANTNPSYIRVNTPSLQIASPKTQLHNGTTNYVPDGGLLRVCSGTMGTCYDVVVPPNGHVVIDGEGVLRVGCPTCPAPSGERIIGRAGGTSENNNNNNGNLGLMNLDGRPVAGSGADFSSLRNNNNSNNNSSLAFDLNADDFTVTVTPTANMSGESLVLADENLVQGSGPRGINSLTSRVDTINVNSEPNGNGEQRRPVTEVVDVGVNTRLPTDRTLETLRDADVPEGTCPDGGTSCFVGSFAPLAPTENEMPSDIEQPYDNDTLTILE